MLAQAVQQFPAEPEPWLRLGNLLAPLIGGVDGEVVVTDTTSVNLFNALAAALTMQAQDPARSAPAR